MIKTKTEDIKGKRVISFKIKGDLSTVVSEVCHTLARGVEVIAEDIGDTQVESTLYAIIRIAIMQLEKDGHIIDRNRLGHALIATEAEIRIHFESPVDRIPMYATKVVEAAAGVTNVPFDRMINHIKTYHELLQGRL